VVAKAAAASAEDLREERVDGLVWVGDQPEDRRGLGAEFGKGHLPIGEELDLGAGHVQSARWWARWPADSKRAQPAAEPLCIILAEYGAADDEAVKEADDDPRDLIRRDVAGDVATLLVGLDEAGARSAKRRTSALSRSA
jgi:hypothetical protein